MRLSHLPSILTLLTLTSALTLQPTTTTLSTPTPVTTPSTSIPTGEFITTKYITLPGETNAHVTLPAKTIVLALPTCVQTITPDKNGYVPPGTCHAFYDYYPSFGAAVLFSFLFGIVTVLHVWQAARYKKAFCWVLIMACLWEFGSFVTRAVSTKYQQNSGLALVTQLLVLLAPLWVNAFDYMLFSRLVHFFLPSHSLLGIPASVFGIVFVALDLVSFVVQLVGGSLAGPTASEDIVMKGIHVYMGGIGLQQFFICLFLALAAAFHREMLRLERSDQGKEGWRWLLYTLYTSLCLITIRIFFRLIEFSAGKDPSKNPLPFHEAYFYVFDAVPMFFALAAMNFVHPGKVLVGPEAEMPGLKSVCCGGRRGKRGGVERGIGGGWKEVESVEMDGEKGK